MKISEALTKARRIIENPVHWAKGNRVKWDSIPTCAGIAIDRIDWSNEYAARRFFEIENEIGSIVNWNDAPERTHKDVLTAFDKAIATAKEAGL